MLTRRPTFNQYAERKLSLRPPVEDKDPPKKDRKLQSLYSLTRQGSTAATESEENTPSRLTSSDKRILRKKDSAGVRLARRRQVMTNLWAEQLAPGMQTPRRLAYACSRQASSMELLERSLSCDEVSTTTSSMSSDWDDELSSCDTKSEEALEAWDKMYNYSQDRKSIGCVNPFYCCCPGSNLTASKSQENEDEICVNEKISTENIQKIVQSLETGCKFKKPHPKTRNVIRCTDKTALELGFEHFRELLPKVVVLNINEESRRRVNNRVLNMVSEIFNEDGTICVSPSFVMSTHRDIEALFPIFTLKQLVEVRFVINTLDKKGVDKLERINQAIFQRLSEDFSLEKISNLSSFDRRRVGREIITTLGIIKQVQNINLMPQWWYVPHNSDFQLFIQWPTLHTVHTRPENCLIYTWRRGERIANSALYNWDIRELPEDADISFFEGKSQEQKLNVLSELKIVVQHRKSLIS